MKIEFGGGFYFASVEAEKSTYSRYPMGAILLKKRRIVGRGANSSSSRKDLKKYDYFSIHAEVDALLRSESKNADTMVVVRLTRSGESLALAKPCNKCIQYMKMHGISKVIYSTAENCYEMMNL